MKKVSGIHELSNELLREIVDYIVADPDRAVNIDRRAYLSVESFRPPSAPPVPRAQDVGNFRLVCKRWAELGIPQQFTRIATRFSPEGFERLEKIRRQPHLARHTKKFSYLIPDFYVEGKDQVRQLFRAAGTEMRHLDPSKFEAKAQMQRDIVRSELDLRTLKGAMAAFQCLQHVQILRLQDELDRHLLEFLNDSDEDFSGLVELKWAPACTHAVRTVAEGLASAGSPACRFSGPMMSADSALALVRRAPRDVESLADRLTCLELHFEDAGPDLGGSIEAMSPAFKEIFSAAKNMQAVHVGFPSRRPLKIRLEAVFHNIRWEKLRAFGVQAWQLDAEEIMGLARRHRRTLRGLRLRDVQLREGSYWRDVLYMLREEMELLEWVSLRRIDYVSNFEKIWSGVMEVPDYPPGTGSESDGEDDFGSQIELDDRDSLGSVSGEYDEDDDDDDDDDSDDISTADTDEGPEADKISLPNTPSSSAPLCTCHRSSYPATFDDLWDKGESVSYQQRKFWEKWVIGTCPVHES